MFIDLRLPARVEAGFSTVASSNVNIVALQNGRERRNGTWANRRRRFRANTATFTDAERELLLAAALACGGPLHAFRFRDFTDYRATAQALGIAPSGSTPVQLIKSYTFGPMTYTRQIMKPVASSVALTQNGAAKAGATDPLTGLFVPSTPWLPGASLAASFVFDVPVRFLTNDVEFVLPTLKIAQMPIELIEVFE